MIYALITVTLVAGLIITALYNVIRDNRDKLESLEVELDLLKVELDLSEKRRKSLSDIYKELKRKYLNVLSSRSYMKKRVNNLEEELSEFRASALQGRKAK